jgi:DNA topoisomerase IA
MSKKSVGDLVIVESPAKAKTIEKYLGEGYTVLSSYGHVRDLPERDLSVDVENGFEPTYIIPDDKKDRLRQLQRKPTRPPPYGSRPTKTAKGKPSAGT